MFFMCTHKQQLMPMRFLSSAKIVYIRITIDNIRRRLGKTNSKKVFFVLHCTRLSLYLHNNRRRLGKANSKKVIFCFAMHSPFTIFT
ncbi:unknown [Prevotella sp. CAG:255]|nr:unknown [Prevotella sp. CAG:255]